MSLKFIIPLSALMLVPYLFFRFILVDLYPQITLPFVTLLIILLPLALHGKGGFFYGLLSGLVFILALISYEIAFNFDSLTEPSKYLSFMGFSIMMPLISGIAGRGLKNKKTLPLWLLVGLIVMWVI